jgi:hypothetical protein
MGMVEVRASLGRCRWCGSPDWRLSPAVARTKLVVQVINQGMVEARADWAGIGSRAAPQAAPARAKLL